MKFSAHREAYLRGARLRKLEALAGQRGQLHENDRHRTVLGQPRLRIDTEEEVG